MLNIELRGKVYTTYDLWDTESYWEIFKGIISDFDKEKIENRVSLYSNAMKMQSFPRDILGKMEDIIIEKSIDDWPARLIYIVAEAAEALWFKENCNVSFKIGPLESESIYDDIIYGFDIGIIGLTQPEYEESIIINEKGVLKESGNRKAVPYIGKKGQNRVFFSDTIIDLTMFRKPWGNPSFYRALQLAEIYEDVTNSRNSLLDVAKVYRLIKLGEGLK